MTVGCAGAETSTLEVLVGCRDSVRGRIQIRDHLREVIREEHDEEQSYKPGPNRVSGRNRAKTYGKAPTM